ncbi:MAG: hypothetical protein U5M23_06415, partial [Marinagarivorans sp.]|nr:hypothetical protein [Marinagarivorans sp.]
VLRSVTCAAQLESIRPLVVGSFVVTTAVAIFWDSVNTIYGVDWKPVSGASTITLWVALFTVALKTILTIYTRDCVSDQKNASIMALARSCN